LVGHVACDAGARGGEGRKERLFLDAGARGGKVFDAFLHFRPFFAAHGSSPRKGGQDIAACTRREPVTSAGCPNPVEKIVEISKEMIERRRAVILFCWVQEIHEGNPHHGVTRITAGSAVFC
jgi:hypothetical protein